MNGTSKTLSIFIPISEMPVSLRPSLLAQSAVLSLPAMPSCTLSLPAMPRRLRRPHGYSFCCLTPKIGLVMLFLSYARIVLCVLPSFLMMGSAHFT